MADREKKALEEPHMDFMLRGHTSHWHKTLSEPNAQSWSKVNRTYNNFTGRGKKIIIGINNKTYHT